MNINFGNESGLTSFDSRIRARVQSSLERIRRIPVAVLLWGPNPIDGSETGLCRLKLRDKLRQSGHGCYFSEELFLEDSNISILAQQMAHVEACDLVFSIPDSPGSIAELHDFSMLPAVSSKIITFLDERWNNGYSNMSLMQRDQIISPNVELYKKDELPDVVIDKALNEVQRLQELFYLLGTRKVSYE